MGKTQAQRKENLKLRLEEAV